MIDLGLNPQAASDAARFTHAQATNKLRLESDLFELVGSRLQELGHDVESDNGEDMGGYQAIWFTPSSQPAMAPPSTAAPVQGLYRAASDHRKDGAAVGW
jgi:gamma-glutamyltranspeptidase/glutathione hydrolase